MTSPRVPDDRAALPLTAGGGTPAASTGAAAAAAAAGPAAPQPEVSFFDAVGGEPTFRRLVDAFYAGVAADPLLRPMYPEEDLGPAAERLTLFLIQYWGGPNTYSAQRGHPRLRMRHAPFRVGAAERDAWLRHMHDAVRSLELPAAYEEALWQYLERAAYFMVNSMEPADQPG